MAPANRGEEAYSAWFGDSDGRVLYFGLSPFWHLWWQSEGDAAADLALPGDHLIGRFDLAAEAFLPPLRVRDLSPRSRSSTWDVLAHSNGRIYFTTYYEEIGSVGADGRDLQVFSGIGTGFNELFEGPKGHVYVTRYSDNPQSPSQQRYGAVVELTPQGQLVREIRFEKQDGQFTAPKSVAVDPGSGEIWLNTDSFRDDGSVGFETLRLSPAGRLIRRSAGPSELHFVSFDAWGRGYFAEVEGGELRLRIRTPGRRQIEIPLGTRQGPDFVQDIQFDPSGTAALAFWSGRVVLVRPTGKGYEVAELDLEKPEDCGAAGSRSILYTAVVHGGHVYATLFCGATILSQPLPADRRAWTHWPFD